MDHVLTRTTPGIEDAARAGSVHVPASFEAEVFVAIRRLLQRRLIDRTEAATALFDIRSLSAEQHDVGELLAPALRLHDRFGGHDVFYVLLAERLGAQLVTSDRPLARAAAVYGVAVRYVGPDA